MKLTVLVLGVVCAACGGSNAGGDDGSGGDGGGGGSDSGTGTSGSNRAVVQIIEQRFGQPEMRNGSATVAISLFDARTFPSCAERVLFEGGACRLTQSMTPVCNLTCGTNEFCFVDPADSCRAKCVKQCGKTCPTGQYCLTQQAGETCVPIEPYEGAGPVTVSGLKTPVMLPAPNYPFMGLQGVVYSGGEVAANASGATSIGIGAFQVGLAPPPDVVANPPLSSLTKADFKSDLHLAWAAGSDQIQVELFVAGNGVSAHGLCTTSDAGSFTVPGGMFAAFPAGASVVRLDLQRVREASTDATGRGFYLGRMIPGPTKAVLRLIKLETNTVAL
jgi:hypothetical protein